MSEDPLRVGNSSRIVAIIAGTILFFVGLASWSALVPVTFLAALHSQTHDPTTRDLLFYALAFYFLLAGAGTLIVASKLKREHWVSRAIFAVFVVILIVGFVHYFWLGTLPNGLETIPEDMGPSPNRQ